MESTISTEAGMGSVTPDTAVAWLDVINNIGPLGFAIIVIGVLGFLAHKNLPRFLTWLESQTATMRDVHNELKEMRSDINDIKNKTGA